MSEQPSKLSRILFCTDFSENAMAAFKVAVEAATRRERCELTLLHVLPEPDAQYWKSYIYEVGKGVDDAAKSALDKTIDESYRPLVPSGVSFKTEFLIGKAPAKILEYAEKSVVDLIVIGRQGSGALKSLLFGSVAEKVVKRSTCPVLVIPMKTQE